MTQSFCLFVGTNTSSNACLTEVISSFMNADTLGLIKLFVIYVAFTALKISEITKTEQKGS